MENLDPTKKESYWVRKIKPNFGIIIIIAIFGISILGGIYFTNPEFFKGTIAYEKGHEKKECLRDEDCENQGGIYNECFGEQCRLKQCKDTVPCPRGYECTVNHNCIESDAKPEELPEKGTGTQEDQNDEQISYSLIDSWKFSQDSIAVKFNQQKEANDLYGFIIFNSDIKTDLANRLTENDYFLEDYIYDEKVLSPDTELIFDISKTDIENYFKTVLDDQFSDEIYVYPYYIDQNEVLDVQCGGLLASAVRDAKDIIELSSLNPENFNQVLFDRFKLHYDRAYLGWQYSQSSSIEQGEECEKREICDEVYGCTYELKCREGREPRLSEDEQLSLDLEYLVDQVDDFITTNIDQLSQNEQNAVYEISEMLYAHPTYSNLIRDEAENSEKYEQCSAKTELIKNSLSEIWKVYADQGAASLIQSYEKVSKLLQNVDTFQQKVEDTQSGKQLKIQFNDPNSDIIYNTEYDYYVVVWSDKSFNLQKHQSPWPQDKILGNFQIVDGRDKYESDFNIDNLSDYQSVFIAILPASLNTQTSEFVPLIPKDFIEAEVKIKSQSEPVYEEHQDQNKQDTQPEPGQVSDLEQGNVQCNLSHPCPEGYYCGQASICRPVSELE